MFCLLSACVAAVGINLTSTHIDSEPWLIKQGINNNNYGAYVELDNGVTFGTYKNTESKQSNYIGFTKWFGEDRLQYGVMVGVVTGYTMGTVPAATANLRYRISDNLHARVFYIPKIDSTTGAHVVNFGFMYTFGK